MKSKIAFIFDIPKHSRARHSQCIEKYLHPKIPFDIFYLADNDELDRVLVKDMTIDITPIIDTYMFIVPVGAEPFKKLIKHKGGVTKYNAQMLTEPFTCIPIMNPLIVYINPSMQPKVEQCFDTILELYDRQGNVPEKQHKEYRYIDSKREASDELVRLSKSKILAYDLETTSLDPLEGTIIGASFSDKEDTGVFISYKVLRELLDLLETVFCNAVIIMHNAKFDIKWTRYHMGLCIPSYEDTMIAHYLLVSQAKGTHSLKTLSMNYTNLSDYSRKQDEYIKVFCRQHKILLADFTFDMIPIDMLAEYAAADADATLQLYNNMVVPELEKADINTVKCYREILLPAADSLIEMELIGAPIDIDRVNTLADSLETNIDTVNKTLHRHTQLIAYEKVNGAVNLNSPVQLGRLLFDYFGFKSVKETATGNRSTDVEVLTELGKNHKFPLLILELRKLKKMYGTYVVNIISLIKNNGRLRGNFNLCATESGRLSSSGDEKE